GMMFGGQVIGIALGTALTGYLISTVGFSISIQVLALLISIVFTAVLIIRERPNEKLLPWLPGEASEASKKLQVENLREIFTTVAKALLRVDSLKLIAVMLLSSISYGLFTSVMPKMANELAGWSTQEYSSLSGTGNLIAGFFCVFIFGILADRLGRKKIILSLLALQCLMIGIAMTFQDLWNTDGFITTAGVSVITLRYGIAVVVAAIAMSLCDLKVSATQFTLYMACSNLGLSIAYALVGVLDEMDGYFALLLAFAGVSVLALVMATTLNVGEETNYANKS
ncbi:MAG: MFS transporter, partial [Flavobacteriales bacterium]|nr:MFS transporter [Flavobacteriales bacterium]